MSGARALGTAALLLALGAGTSCAQVQTDFNADPAKVQAGTYAVEPEHTRVLFAVAHLGFSTWYGDFSKASGTLVLDPKRPEASRLEVSVPTATVASPSAKLDGELKGADWLDAAVHPAMTFRSQHVAVTGPGQGEVTGELTLHGVTKPVVLAARFNGSGTNPLDGAYTVGFEVSGKIRRSEFGVAKFVPLVGDEVTLIISAAFERKSP